MADMTGKRVVITGPTRGIGRATALALARMGADLALVARDRGRGDELLAKLRAEGKGSFDLYIADLSSQRDVRRVAAEILAKWDRIDVLVNNAGAIFTARETSVDGVELTIATNHLSYFLLTKLLLPALEAAAPGARIVNVASKAHFRGAIDFGDLGRMRSYDGLSHYGTSKLMNVLFTRELAKRLEGKGITVNCLHPGVVASSFTQNNKNLLGRVVAIGWKLASPFLLSEEDGAKTSIHLATAPDVADVTGKYFDECKEARISRAAADDALAAKLWDESERLVAGTEGA
ncbi:MAG: SDR family NAD(P)-dependent oxidoreductase [Myxococcales bacterium]|jgi:NAD(P)-dependent dehydrogenase (short-subunit alcohol dehydrogenase family)|nr:SDR family NAD(P)-dependent oxidoreductase [Myxococcales bacterium]